jgi:hypothetical protein
MCAATDALRTGGVQPACNSDVRLAVVLADGNYLAGDAITFWAEQLRGPVPDDLAQWLRERVMEVQLLWRDVTGLNRTRGMWKELTGALEARDPTCAWTRNYDRLYVDSQVMRLTRMVQSRNRPEHVSLNKLLGHFLETPEVLGIIQGRRSLPSIVNPADPVADLDYLKKLVRRLRQLRDKSIAHTELDVRLPELDWPEMDKAIDGVTAIFSHYSARLTGVNYQVDFDEPRWSTWKSAFSEPLFPSTNT